MFVTKVKKCLSSQLVVSLLCLLIVFELVLLLPQSRLLIIRFVENNIIHHSVLSITEKSNYLFDLFIFLLALTISVPLIIYTVKKYINTISSNFINLLRVMATMMVFLLHVSIFTNSKGELFVNRFISLLRTPAWGGVWIFFILSGYLSGKGFNNEKYIYTYHDISKYYQKKLNRIYIPTLFFIFICCVLVYPNFIVENPFVVVKFLTSTYNGNPGVNGIGATWYVFTLLPLYFISPFLCYLTGRINKKFGSKSLFFLLVLVIAFGLSYRLFASMIKLDWYNHIYTPFYANIDLFFVGLIVAYIESSRALTTMTVKLVYKQVGFLLLLFFILINILTYNNSYLYTTVYPTIYIILVSINLLLFGDSSEIVNEHKYISFVVNKFAEVSFEFYLFHSLVLFKIIDLFSNGNITVLHFELIAISFIITMPFSIGFHKVFNVEKKS